MSGGSIMYPNVTSLPGQSAITPAERQIRKKQGDDVGFDKILDNALSEKDVHAGLDKIKAPLKFSAHATQRLRDRKIDLDQGMLSKVNDAIDKAQAKGVEETLVLTPDAALIVSVKNRTVITALDRNSLSGNVFTNIDGAVVV